MNRIDDTICAVSTAAGVGGIAVIRVSGPDAIEIADRVFRASGVNDMPLVSRKSHTLIYGEVRDETGNIIDEVVVSLFRKPHSYTAEDVVEISCHGSLYIQQQIISLLLRQGCRMADAGEFTRRAFANGKMDLSQAEAVADLIASSSAAAHRLAMNQMRGGFSRELGALREKLLDFASLIELELDFSEEEVEFADREHLTQLASRIENTIEKLIESFDMGNAIKNGIPTAIIGETNAGKSTLLNRLLHEERALVSEIHGTTRDVIEDTINLRGVTFRFIDTAGIRDTQDKIENMGIELTYRKLNQARIVLWVIDTTQPFENLYSLAENILSRSEDKKLILVFNKSDQADDKMKEDKKQFAITIPDAEYLFVSAKENENIDLLENRLISAAQLPKTGTDDVIVTNARHYDALTKAYNAIKRIQEGLRSGLSGDFLSQDIRECMHYLGEITGEISTDDILGNIFSKFCIGK
ncbi:tRNA uridine-5-carboxymethylaminomethyl(34) synthesis GTPase MnmE [Coprobacter tertius]|uniref:tRNA modification GTPase MnmE n=1 Tax=Coprobacter tertius TaxID=2944915 RepID=A0ABT1MKH7_9BACT|nr:tRNA uridine-5-carboxymethylaminomethyl(34) synthesis GTPase MnmE [Coprobacter tertius]MCP9611736.1 tRNA uridine-5-carboxymethylaminomethyl(34) synthesis GTPase MnmE [Coprobacter tertius]